MTDIPLPKSDAQTRPFWEGCLDGRLRFQRCEACGAVQCTPRASCMRCHSPRLAWEASSRWGTVMTYTRVHRAPIPAFKEKTPYVIAILDMDEGFRLMVNASEAITDAIRIGSRVRVGFTQVGDVALPIAEELG